ncbi:metallophosphoesterase family protein [Streptomyces sp. A7024]|uniref:Metallophosphoesterase family protein n=1 Tax=Streptomyces coryli TaxID=1128680 RepID=A0A6G4U1X2_9ACTN|nr:metallophosphoesterase family protein [Streptomyces coryli]NGN66083.1 metallophosphoesterase family protein [Streptomyces coryli]
MADVPGIGIPAQLAERMSMAEQHEYVRRALSRRRVIGSAGGLAAGGLLAACSDDGGKPTDTPSPATGDTTGSATAPFGRHLALGTDPRTQMRISWQVPNAVKKPFVRYGTEPGELTERAAAELRPLKTPSLGPKLPGIEQYYVHAALNDLDPGTTYHYALGHEGYDDGKASASFRTAPAMARAFTFTAFGDQGITRAARTMGKLIGDRDPAFHLHAGDICYAEETGHGREDDSKYDARVWDAFLKQIDPVAAKVPWMIATGNHDMEAYYSPDGYGGQFARWSFPARQTYYSFVYGNVAVVSLDANDVSYEIPANLGYTDGKQTRWLDETLGRLRADSGVDFIVVFFHHCAYSSSTHASDGGVRSQWVPLFDKHRVDLVINGHNHVYERTDAIRSDALQRPLPVGGSAEPARDGTVYVTAGGGGRELFDFSAPDSYAGHQEHRDSVRTFTWRRGREKDRAEVEWSRVRYTGYSFLTVEAVPGARPRLKCSAHSDGGMKIDSFELVGA